MERGERRRLTRRQVLTGIAGTGVGAVGAAALAGVFLGRDRATANPLLVENQTLPITSNLWANQGQPAFLHVRRFLAPGPVPPPDREQVVMVAGRTSPALVSFDLQSDKPGPPYSWARVLAEAGFDVWVMDFQGMGLSSRPDVMNDKCNVLRGQQPVLGVNCPPSYAGPLGNSHSDWQELHTVVEHVRFQTAKPNQLQQKRVILVGYSAGAFAVGPYAIHQPGKVKGILLLAPIFPPQGRSRHPQIATETLYPLKPVPAPTTPEAFFGAPMGIGTKNPVIVDGRWIPGTGLALKSDCGGDPSVVDDIWRAMRENDPEGAKWSSALAPEGVYRHRGFPLWWGWNDAVAANGGRSFLPEVPPVLGHDTPVCVIDGEDDGVANFTGDTGGQGEFRVRALYDAISGPRKLYYKVACAGHLLMWEGRRDRLHQLSVEWLRGFTAGGLPGQTGAFYVPLAGPPQPMGIESRPRPRVPLPPGR
ncbi:alpha/beta hydrolase [Micromonospora coxensis]|uniref:Alpha/beta hydrolase family protein n=1 Tax=Micromonospora coxensis TaxID=356852 RepID=A0A1C5GYN4_9ACTN|nr:alpha/beta fold hydrolase [Micromonospora coxensis]SCG38912.1 Alpha/beta hydrolase family protein [Micromonospora coxensis]